MVELPIFTSSAIASSADAQYRPRAIQIYGRPRFEGHSSHQDDYPVRELPMQQRCRPAEAAKSNHPFSGSSTYGDNYPAHPLQPQPKREQSTYRGSALCIIGAASGFIGSNAKFDATSSYAQDFDAKGLPAARECCRRESRPVTSGKFDATSHYSDSFPAHSLPERATYQHYQGQRPTKHVPFDAKTAYEETFVKHENSMRVPILPKPDTHGRNIRFEGISTQHTDFVPYPVDSMGKVVRPPLQTIRHLPFDATTTNSTEYKHWTGVDPRQAIKRQDGTVRSLMPFEGTTTSKDTFKSWALPVARKGLGIATVGDRLHMFIPAQLPIPATHSQTFTTVLDGQTEMCMMVYEGNEPVASKNTLLGQFKLERVPAAPVGVPRVKVTYLVNVENCLTVEALDLCSGVRHLWQPQGMEGLQPSSVMLKAAMLPSSQAVAVCS